MKNQYVILTGGKNNAGDHLIKYRAKELFKLLKPDTKIIDMNGWEELDNTKLTIVNQSKALILVGGPALMKNMYPRVYKLRENLDDIKVPILTMGIGWYSKNGNWEDTYQYLLSSKTLELLTKINNNKFKSSVRDYHTLNVLQQNGFKNFLMTGCPALYSEKHINQGYKKDKKIRKIAYSLGVSMKTSNKMFKQMQNILLLIQDIFPDTEITIVFHHSPSKEYLHTHGSNKSLYKMQQKYLQWLKDYKFNYIDISGSHEELIKYYTTVDLHIGYRVHAHIFMNSISKPSILLNEDGRGKALDKVIGGVSFNAFVKMNDSIILKILHKCLIRLDNYKDNVYLLDDLRNILDYELTEGVKFSQTRIEIDHHYDVMKKFIKQLP